MQFNLQIQGMRLLLIVRKCHFDKHRHSVQFALGQKVFLEIHPIFNALHRVEDKFCTYREGPFRVKKRDALNFVKGHPLIDEPVRLAHAITQASAFER